MRWGSLAIPAGLEPVDPRFESWTRYHLQGCGPTVRHLIPNQAIGGSIPSTLASPKNSTASPWFGLAGWRGSAYAEGMNGENVDWPWERQFVALSFGGGVNSTALLCGLWERYGRLPEIVLFADTGGEFLGTYNHVREMRDWVEVRGGRFEIVSNADPEGERHGHKSLEDECHRNKTLPSLAFGFKGCSAKWKRQPMDRFLRELPEVKEYWRTLQPVVRLIGIDADEAHRSANLDGGNKWQFERPLVDWDWGREECIEAIKRQGLEVPGKSACWFCPAMKKREVLELARLHPQLFERALKMEKIAKPGLKSTTKGLGRRWSWGELVEADRRQLRLFPESPEIACMCDDG